MTLLVRLSLKHVIYRKSQRGRTICYFCQSFPPFIVKNQVLLSKVWWYTPTIPALKRLRQEDYKFEVNLSYGVIPHLKTRNKKFCPLADENQPPEEHLLGIAYSPTLSCSSILLAFTELINFFSVRRLISVN
jgi:hypothetical protein